MLECLAENNNGAFLASEIAPLFPQELIFRGCLKSDKKCIQLRGLSYIVSSSSAALPNPGDTADDQSQVETNPSLKVLDLSLNSLTDTDMELLTSSLQQNTTIETLNLSFNFLGAEDLHSIARVLELNCCLRSLNLSWNSINYCGMMAVANALPLKATLSELNLRGNSRLFWTCNELGQASVKRIDLSSVNFRNTIHSLINRKLIDLNKLFNLEYLNMSNCSLALPLKI